MAVSLDDPRPDDVRRALERVLLRWRQLPVDRAAAMAGDLRQCAARCAALLNGAVGDVLLIPDLGPATASDQLSVTVFDACAAHRCKELAGWLSDLLERLR